MLIVGIVVTVSLTTNELFEVQYKHRL